MTLRTPVCAALGVILAVLLCGCARSTGPCPEGSPVDMPMARFASDDRFPFQFPLDELPENEAPRFTNFCDRQENTSPNIYHAAEDFFRPAGTPVYAMADGEVSFSGPMGGYGWLIIIDHPQANLYSLYGHLSPSRWHMEPGPVEKGQLIAYLGDSDENGGTAERPLPPHLHLGVRVGQRADYPGLGEGRWQAGWIKICPPELGWLQPSAIIAGQEIPAGGFQGQTPFLAIWGMELLFLGVYVVGGACMLIFALKRNQPLILLIACGFLTVAGCVFHNKALMLSYGVLAVAALLAVAGIGQFVVRRRRDTQSPS